MKQEETRRFLTLETSSVVEAMQQIDATCRGILFIADEQQRLTGVVTDGDIRRWLIKTGSLKDPISKFMNKNPKFIYKKELHLAQKKMETYCVTALPVLGTKGDVIDIVFRTEIPETVKEQKEGLRDVSVVIMAGGKGTRLYPYTKILPKPLIPIGDIPIMERIINKFCEYGVREFLVTVNYKKSMIRSYFAENSHTYDIAYIEEEKPLGTAGSLRLIEKPFKKPLIVTNCDILIHADYEDIYRHHLESGSELTIVSALKNIVVPYGVIHPSENGAILSMEEKPRLSYFVNTGMYILNPGLLEEIPKNTFFHMTDLSDKLLKEGRRVGMYPISEDSFLDMGEFEEMRRMETKLNQKAE